MPVLSSASIDEPPDLAEILDRVRISTGVDLAAYRQASIVRRAANRLKMAGCNGYQEYLALLATDPEEARRFLEYVVIKWSRFFRDAPVFDLLRTVIVPQVLASTGGEIAMWSAGCGRGEEPYSLAMLLDQVLPPASPGVTVYATDIDETALAAARERIYTSASVEGVADSMLSAHFAVRHDRSGNGYLLNDRFADSVHFLRHDLLSGFLPVERQFHLVLCRNVLIYLRRQSQEIALRLLSSSVTPGGYLCLGEAEQLPAAYCSEYGTVDRKLRIYRKKSCDRAEVLHA